MTTLAKGDGGAELLDEVEAFLSRFVAYPNEHSRIAHVLWIGHTWFMDSWDSTPRIAFLSPEPGSGKSRALEVTEPLVPRPVHAVNASTSALFRTVADPNGAPTILFDEIDTIFGPRAKENEELRGLLNAGHRRGATTLRAVVRGQGNIEVESFPAYCAVALAGLDDLPDTIMTRSVVVRMRRRAPDERVEPWRLRVNGAEAEALQERLRLWANANTGLIAWPEMPEGVEDRNADVWEALLAVADLAAGHWPERARVAAVTAVTDARQARTSLGIQLLRDLRSIFTAEKVDRIASTKLVELLNDLEESPWSDLRGKPLDSAGLARQLKKYNIGPTTVRFGDTTAKGYVVSDPREDYDTLADAWRRYLPPLEDATTGDSHPTAQGVTPVTPETIAAEVTDVTTVTPVPEGQAPTLGIGSGPGRCPSCEYHVTSQGHRDGCEVTA